jgi:hypothetical protein
MEGGEKRMDSGVTQKQSTILTLAGEIEKGLLDLQTRLDSYFNKAPRACGEGKNDAMLPNVLDDILQTLERDKSHLWAISDFISTKVLPKIS